MWNWIFDYNKYPERGLESKVARFPNQNSNDRTANDRTANAGKFLLGVKLTTFNLPGNTYCTYIMMKISDTCIGDTCIGFSLRLHDT